MDGDQFLSGVRQRLAQSGAELRSTQAAGSPDLIAFRSEFRVTWVLTKLHLFIMVSTVPTVTADGLARFTSDSLAYANAQKGKLRGFQSGIATIAVLAGDDVEPAAVEYARETLLRKFAAFGWPAVVDLSSGRTQRHEGRVLLGGIYASWMRQQSDLVLGS